MGEFHLGRTLTRPNKRKCGAEVLGLASSPRPTDIVRPAFAFWRNEPNKEKRSNYKRWVASNLRSEALLLPPRLRHHVERHRLARAHVVEAAPQRRHQIGGPF